MATPNPFDLLDDDAEDPSQLIAAVQLKAAAAAAAAAPPKKAAPALQTKTAKLPSKPPPPAQAVREAKTEGGRGGGRGGGHGYGRDRGGGGGSNISAGQGVPEGEAGKTSERRGYGGPRTSYRGGHRDGFGNGEVGGEERPRRAFERHSGTGRGNEFKREGSGRGNWGNQTDELAQVAEEAINDSEKKLGDVKPIGEENAADGKKEDPANETEEKEPEEKEMTLEEYEKVLEEKRKSLQVHRTEGRKVDVKEFKEMQQLSSKKDSHDVFIKLGSDKDKRKEAFEKEERVKKSLNINEFLKSAEGERHYSPGGRGRGRGRGSRGGFGGGQAMRDVAAPAIEDPGQFPTLGGK